MGEIADDDDFDINQARDGLILHARYHGHHGIADKLEAGQPFDYGPEQPYTPPPELARPNPARMYDYYLGGRANFKVDRVAAEQVITAYPGIVVAARANRSFLARAVRYLSDQGVDQFLDLGSGIPTVGNVHQIAQQANPHAAVVYVDIEPIATAHAAGILAGNHRATVIRADLAQPDRVLDNPAVRGLLDLTRPVAVLMVSVLVFVPDDADPAGVVAAYRDAVAPGSYLVVSHGCTEPAPTQAPAVHDAQAVYNTTTGPVTLRTADQITGLFTGCNLVDPGLVSVTHWRPNSGDPPAGAVPVLAAVARKP